MQTRGRPATRDIYWRCREGLNSSIENLKSCKGGEECTRRPKTANMKRCKKRWGMHKTTQYATMNGCKKRWGMRKTTKLRCGSFGLFEDLWQQKTFELVLTRRWQFSNFDSLKRREQAKRGELSVNRRVGINRRWQYWSSLAHTLDIRKGVRRRRSDAAEIFVNRNRWLLGGERMQRGGDDGRNRFYRCFFSRCRNLSKWSVWWIDVKIYFD